MAGGCVPATADDTGDWLSQRAVAYRSTTPPRDVSTWTARTRLPRRPERRDSSTAARTIELSDYASMRIKSADMLKDRWLRLLMEEAVTRNWCLNFDCTTCGAREFRSAVTCKCIEIAGIVLDRSCLDCLTSALIGQNGRIEQGRVSGSSSRS